MPTDKSVNDPGGDNQAYAKSVERKAAGARTDPATATVWFEYGQVLDPYGDFELSPEEHCVGREWFAADPEERIAVHFHDLPTATRDALEGKQKAADREGWALLLSCWRDHSNECREGATMLGPRTARPQSLTITM